MTYDAIRASDAAMVRLRARHPDLIDLTTGRILRLLEALGRPQDRLPPVIHVAGTNGKGSTSQMVTRLLMEQGLKVGTDTSPHLERINELQARLESDIDDKDQKAQMAVIAGEVDVSFTNKRMTLEQMKSRLESAFPDGDIEVVDMTGTRDHWQVAITSNAFKGLSRIECQRRVMSTFDAELKSGEVHALTIKTLTKN